MINEREGLEYIGRGAGLIGVPARDLSAEEVSRYGRRVLLRSGLYKKPEPIEEPDHDQESE